MKVLLKVLLKLFLRVLLKGYTEMCPWVHIDHLEKQPANQYRPAVLESVNTKNSATERDTGNEKGQRGENYDTFTLLISAFTR